MSKINILSVNISAKKGTIKHPVPAITLTENGIEGDAHSGPWNRQVSMLGMESIRRFEQEANRKINFGEFAENITTEGLELWKCQPLDRFTGEEVELEVTQIGKECHGASCAIFKEVGNCVMPKEGIFARVIGSSQLAVGKMSDARSQMPDTRSRIWHPASLSTGMSLLYLPKIFSVRIITLSDRAFHGEYEDRSGPRIQELLTSHVSRLTSHVTLLPDDPNQLLNTLKKAIDAGTDFIFTTGGTGIGPRDFTPEVVKSLLEKEIPGIMEMIRTKYGAEKQQALLSRSVAGVAGNTLIFTLPGSVKAVNEYMQEIMKSLMHMVYMLHGLDTH